MNCRQSNSLNLSLSGTGRPRNATLTPQGSPDRKVAKAHASSIVTASSIKTEFNASESHCRQRAFCQPC